MKPPSHRIDALEGLRRIESKNAIADRKVTTDAFGRLMDALSAACPDPVQHTTGGRYSCEPHLRGIADRLVASAANDDDRRILASLSAADLVSYGMSGPQFVVMMAAVYGQF